MTKLADIDLRNIFLFRKRFLEDFFLRLKEGGIEYSTIRNHALIFDRPDKDIDLLVNPSDFRKVQRIFQKLSGHANVVPISNNVSNKNLYLKSLLIGGEKGEAIEGIYIHCAGFITIKNSRFARKLKGIGKRIWLSDFNKEEITIDSSYVNVPDPKFQLLFTLAKYGQSCNSRHLDEIRQIINTNNLSSWVKKIDPHEFLIGLESPTQLNTDVSTIQSLQDNCLLDIVSKSPRWKLAEYAQLLLINFVGLLEPKGKLIFFSGPDGSGKTSANMALSGILAEKLNVKIENRKALYPFSTRLQKEISTVQAKIRKIEPSDKFLMERDRSSSADGNARWKARRFAGLVFLLLQVVPGYLNARLLNLMGRTVVVDTSFFDVFIKGHRPPFPLIQKLVIPLLPTGDYWFLMCADANSIVARKPELTKTEIEAYYAYFNSLKRQPTRIESVHGIERALVDMLNVVGADRSGL